MRELGSVSEFASIMSDVDTPYLLAIPYMLSPGSTVCMINRRHLSLIKRISVYFMHLITEGYRKRS